MKARAAAPCLALLLAVASVAGAEPTIRVSLGDGLRFVEVAAADLVTVAEPGSRRPLFALPGGQVIRVAPAPPGLEVGPRRLAVAAVRLEARRGPLRLGTRDYSGALEVWRSGEGLLLINELGLEEYVAGTVRAETSEKWPAESLRAMAVVARTYASFLKQRNAAKRYHLIAGNQDQNYGGRVADDSPALEAARATAGQVLTWGGRVFPTFYHSDSGGVTEPPQTVFSGEGGRPAPARGARRVLARVPELRLGGDASARDHRRTAPAGGPRRRRGGGARRARAEPLVPGRVHRGRALARHDDAQGDGVPADPRLRRAQEHAVRAGAGTGRGGALRRAGLGPRSGPLAVRRQGDGGAWLHLPADPRVLLPGHEARHAPMRHAMSTRSREDDGKAGGTPPP
ncbi:MAG: SpoIID/LytB domain-containing protein [Candidatus Rokubacteria bacterium]|nr:SpoIID/LytB domain-containing protein [Candidatus Rokubacteria bacterium]